MRWETSKFGSKGGSWKIITHSDRGEYAINQGNLEILEVWFDQAVEYWKQAIAPSPGNYIEAQNQLKITGCFSSFN